MRNWLATSSRRLIAVVAVVLAFAVFLPAVAQGTISPFYAVTFHENDSPSDDVSTYESLNAPSDLTTYADLSPAFSNPGSIFEGWNTLANGGGASYADGSSYSFTANLDLFAQWSQGFNAVTFFENASSGDAVSTYESRNVPSDLTLFSDLAPTFTRPGFSFSNWNTAPDGSGTSYANGALFDFGNDITLYAQWIADATTTTTIPGGMFTVSFNDGGGTGALSPVTVTSGSSVQLPSASSLTYEGFSQTGWFTASTGGSLVGLGGTSFIPSSSLTLFAQWTAGSSDSISFSANGGSGTVPSISAPAGLTQTLPTGVGLLNTGFVFGGWSPTSTSQSLVYSAGAPYVVTGSATLYAVWTVAGKTPVVSELAGAVGPFPRGSSVLGPTIRRQIHNIASGMKTKDFASASMFGYSLATEKGANAKTLSERRATAVENYLRGALVALHVEPVVMHATGEGLIKDTNSPAFRRVEIFLKL